MPLPIGDLQADETHASEFGAIVIRPHTWRSPANDDVDIAISS